MVAANHRLLIDGSYKELIPENDEIYAFRRENSSSAVTILVNFTDHIVHYDKKLIDGSTLLLSDYPDSEAGELKPYESALYIK